MSVNVDKDVYNKEQDELLKAVLNARFFYPWAGYEPMANTDQNLQQDSNLELYITNACNQKCEYCYLVQHPELYPADKRSPELILKNLRILYDWIMEKQYHIGRLDMFSGEIWQSKFGLDVLDITYEYAEKGMMFNDILIASNCSFVGDPIQLQAIQQRIDKFNAIGRPLFFSISIDGKFIDNEGRQRNNDTKYTDEFYHTLFSFAKHNTFYFHPMVSSHNAHLWHDNLQWWKKMMDYYNFDLHTTMFLEVRNNDWTDESIKDYCDFIIELANDYLYNKCHGDLKMLANIIGNVRINSNMPLLNGYYPWVLTYVDNFPGCSICNHLTVRLGDMAICPCHRTAYDKYLYGHFVIENDKIVDIKARNPQMAIKVLMGNHLTTMIKCDTCKYRYICLKGCFGSQLESTEDPFICAPTVCKFFAAKYNRIVQWYKETGILNYLKSVDHEEFGADELQKVLAIVDMIEGDKNEMVIG